MFPHLLLGLVMERIDPGFSLRHVALFFCRLSPTQRNNDIDNQELLAIKLALEEWPHWFEGTEQPFIIWTDHKNSLASSQLSGKTHIRQGGLYTLEVLTFTSQVPIISNLMSCHASTFWRTLVQTGHHPAFCIAAVTWEMESLVKKGQIQQPDAYNAPPPNCLFIPDSVCFQVLQWAHSIHLTCHPGINRTLAFRRQQFWWPIMYTDIQSFISTCSVCAQNKSSPGPGGVPTLPCSMLPPPPRMIDNHPAFTVH